MRKTGEAQTLFASAAEKLESLFAGRVALRSIPEKAEGCDHDRPSADDTRRVAYKFRVLCARTKTTPGVLRWPTSTNIGVERRRGSSAACVTELASQAHGNQHGEEIHANTAAETSDTLQHSPTFWRFSLACHPTIQCRAKVRMSVRTDITRFWWHPVTVLTQTKVTISLGQRQSKIRVPLWSKGKYKKIPKHVFTYESPTTFDVTSPLWENALP